MRRPGRCAAVLALERASALADACAAPACAGGVGIKVAWVGDSRAVLARYTDGAKTVVQALTRDHKASDVMEAARIEAFYAALARRPSSTRSQGSDSEDGSVRLCSSLMHVRFAYHLLHAVPRGKCGAGGASGLKSGADG